MKKLIVPKDLYGWLGNYVDMMGDDSSYFEVLNDLMNDYHGCVFDDETLRFIYYYMREISEVISGKREYDVEKEAFYALIKGWEKSHGTPHWAYHGTQGGFTINYHTGYPEVIVKMTKDEWNELGIDDSNAIFTLTLK